MPYSIGGNGGSTISGEISLSSFAFQKSNQPQDIGTDLVQILDFPYPCKVYIFNEEGEGVEIRFSPDDLHSSAIVIEPGICWIETFSSVSLFAKSDGQSKIRMTLFSNQPPASGGNNYLNVTPLEIIAGEPSTGFEITETPVTFTLEIRRENTAYQIDAATSDLEIHLSKLYEETTIPVDITAGYFSDYTLHEVYLNNSDIWQQQITISEPGRFFLSSYFNMAGSYHVARLNIDLANSKMEFVSEITL